MTTNNETIKKLRAMHAEAMKSDNDLLQSKCVEIRKRIIELGGRIEGRHCQSCGTLASSFQWDELRDADGYSPCCNELFISKCNHNDCFHTV
jgi:NMD protein affecting ribosome stability and mRNA decay